MHKPIVIEAAYKPRDTSLVKQCLASGCRVFVGVQMLIEQGLEQFRLWTKVSPEKVVELREPIENAVYDFYENS